ncbi:hypothetical protein HH310_04780 [Actinoplanes sp. TBRC 11911]|uniref:hypothetical protein n=1 Tax=Actinoplanes sp. TBRC 11911 TaxID=2729386 RepID=UPI00145D941B|nr:hypothetical protein [Actinoplanes sp. TBRC 11911]NMO50508.1 hypothetical protein [Actinoplanes sp. TBRC 11911]
MEIFATTFRPWTPLTSACAPSALKDRPVAVMAAERAPVSRVHQVQIQAELAQELLLVSARNGNTSTTGFKGIDVSTKRYADGGNGVPPRGRPV